jgi:para-nitrobenzyl esterase
MLRVVNVENGWVQGLPAADPRITSFKGIPFAAPPVGENRWRAPQPVKDWEGVLNAYEFAPVSMQARQEIDDNNIYTREWAVEPDIAMDEDCLYLNVWTPANRTDEKLPVYV